MGIGAGLAGAKFAFFSRFRAAGGAANRELLLASDFHNPMMGVRWAGIWSIMNSFGARRKHLI